MSTSSEKLWGGRFRDEVNEALAELNNSLPIDRRLYAEDLDGSKAYAEALKLAGILTNVECEQILAGIELVRYEWIENLIEFQESDEDVHTVNERRLIELCGPPAAKIHTGRSRNDQVVTDMKLWLRKAVQEMQTSIRYVIEAIVASAERTLGIIFPGYTHLQRAQPIFFSHWLLSHAFALQADYFRLNNFWERNNSLPLGCGALAGNPLGIDRNFLAKRLRFARCTQNSLHTVGDRDFVVEFNFIGSLIAIHLSRLAEDLIIYATKEFDFVKIADEFSTGSSLMPQKRNPDSLELVRGISGPILGDMVGFMVSVKGLPSTYNKDLQFDKKSMFNTFDQLKKTLAVVDGVIRSVVVNETKCAAALSPDMLATDWAYYLVKKGVPFRTAHHIVGKIVAYAEENNTELNKLSWRDLKPFSDKFEQDISYLYDFDGSVEQYTSIGGTSTESVKTQIKDLRQFLTK